MADAATPPSTAGSGAGSRPGTKEKKKRRGRYKDPLEDEEPIKLSFAEQLAKAKADRETAIAVRKVEFEERKPKGITSGGIMFDEAARYMDREDSFLEIELNVPSVKDQLVVDPECMVNATEEMKARWTIAGLMETEASKAMDATQIRCPACGTAMANAHLVDLYRCCIRCKTVLREPSALAPDGWHPPAAAPTNPDEKERIPPLRLLCASYGHLEDSSQAVDVFAILNRRFTPKDPRKPIRVVDVPVTEDLRRTFAAAGAMQLCPGEPKCLRLRYESISGPIHAAARRPRAEILAVEEREGFLKRPVHIDIPNTEPVLVVHSAAYGQPGGSSYSAGCNRGSFDITEMLQARVDAGKGSFIKISHDEHIPTVFGDPSPGKTKDLTIKFEIKGTKGEIHESELNNHLIREVSVHAQPVVTPLLIITKAYWGLTPENLKKKKKVVSNQLFEIKSLKRARNDGAVLSRDDLEKIRREGELQARHKRLAECVCDYVDVTDILQRWIEKEGGNQLTLWGRERPFGRVYPTGFVPGKQMNLNELFSCNPMPQQPKQLTIKYEIPGHDAEKTANSQEVTPAGFQRNYIRTNRGKVVLEVDYVPGGVEEAVLETDFELQAPNVLPIIEIGNASYGHPTDPKHIFDVTPEMRRIVTKAGGYRIHLSKEESMWHLFNDPARGIRKKLNVFYSVRGYMGNVRIRTKFGKLQADCELGYRPEAGLESGLTRQIDANDHEGMAFQRRMELMAAVQAVRPKDSASGNDTAYDALDGVEKKLRAIQFGSGNKVKKNHRLDMGKAKSALNLEKPKRAGGLPSI